MAGREPTTSDGGLDRRARRRQETKDEILDLAIDLMTERGVNGLTISEVARRMGMRQPSIYKYYPSVSSVYDALFKRAANENLTVLREAMAEDQPGLGALTSGLEASGRWVLSHQALAQLLFWRPVPDFEPSPEAFEPSEEIARLQQHAIADAVAVGELGPGALDDAGMMVAILIKGILTQAMANEPHLPWDEGRYTPMFPRLMSLLPLAYPPKGSPAPTRRSKATKRPDNPSGGQPAARAAKRA